MSVGLLCASSSHHSEVKRRSKPCMRKNVAVNSSQFLGNNRNGTLLGIIILQRKKKAMVYCKSENIYIYIYICMRKVRRIWSNLKVRNEVKIERGI